MVHSDLVKTLRVLDRKWAVTLSTHEISLSELEGVLGYRIDIVCWKIEVHEPSR